MSGKNAKPMPTGLPIIHERAAGIDIGSRFHVAAVSPDLSDEPVRTFQAFTSDLHRMADWLIDVGIKTVAMESTGVYWVAAYEVLESRGLDVMLANAHDAQAVPGRKSDVNDAQWLQRLHACGLLRASFRPGRDIAALRSVFALTRAPSGLCCSTHPAYAKGADLHEFATAPCHQRPYRGDGHEDYSCHCRWGARS